MATGDSRANPFASHTILLVDDSSDDAVIMKNAFRKAGVTNSLQLLTNGEDAIAYLSGEGPYSNRTQFPLPSVILLDLNMPRTDGFEFLKWLRVQPNLRRTPVEVLTASGRPEDIARAFDAGANGYLIKPSDFEGMAEMVHSWCRLMKFKGLLSPSNKISPGS
jgi:CheY-like chemotaxis protein